MKFGQCDIRPRIHVRSTATGVRWGSHPNSLGREARTAGAALDAALEQLGAEAGRGAVVILEGRE